MKSSTDLLLPCFVIGCVLFMSLICYGIIVTGEMIRFDLMRSIK